MNINMKEARRVVARIAKEQWGWEWKDANHITTLSDEQVINTLIVLIEATHGIRKVYADMINRSLKALEDGDSERARNALDWREDMGK